ncbi:DUF7128 family protein [Salinilacihabitans rarus]
MRGLRAVVRERADAEAHEERCDAEEPTYIQ